MGNNLIHCPFAQEVLFIGDSEKANNILLEKSLRVGQTSEEELSRNISPILIYWLEYSVTYMV